MYAQPLYVYLQRPDTGEWVTVGRYQLDTNTNNASFRYAASCADAGLAWSIDPVNLPFSPDTDFLAPRYGGLHDVLRDAAPDGWGKLLLHREHGLPLDAHESRFMTLAGNADRWGALAVGAEETPAIARLANPQLHQLDAMAQELLAIADRRPPVDAQLRQRLVAAPSLGGARPKAIVQDGESFWLVKPRPSTDTADVPLLEHACRIWGTASGLRFAETIHHRLDSGLSVLRVRRFDRDGERRMMTISAASLLQTEYPRSHDDEAMHWSYPDLAEALHRIGAPDEDRRELFGRMVFNAIVGNDDDHPRNHAVLFEPSGNRWRLSPAYDVVANTGHTPDFLTLQVSSGRYDIAREALLAEAVRFGFDSVQAASAYLDAFLLRAQGSYEQLEPILSADLRSMLHERLRFNLGRLT